MFLNEITFLWNWWDVSHTVVIYWGRLRVFSGNVDTRVTQLPRKTPKTCTALGSGHLKGKIGTFIYKWSLIFSVCYCIIGISNLFHAQDGWELCKILLPIFVLWSLMSAFSQGCANGVSSGLSCVRVKSWGWLWNAAPLMSGMFFGKGEQTQ